DALRLISYQRQPQKSADPIVANSKGQVTEIKEDGEVIAKFNYDGTKSRASRPENYDMTMTTDGGDIFYIQLNEKGFIEYAFEEENNDTPSSDEWWFKYNDNGQMVEMKRTEGDNEVTSIKYNADGDIVEVRVKDDIDGEKHVTTVGYTDATHATAIVNKSGMMLFDDSFRIDMDEMAPAYFAGLLGKGTVHLPLSAVEKTTIKSSNYTDKSDYTFQWILSSSDMPVKFISTQTYDGGYTDVTEVEFKW
ncbi:MAG: DUF4595 domain-containing protein, partial [Bacteroidales bacterium]|nr:DUF4595 domain-containing protein [Bacteroidales bacterium]